MMQANSFSSAHFFWGDLRQGPFFRHSRIPVRSRCGGIASGARSREPNQWFFLLLADFVRRA